MKDTKKTEITDQDQLLFLLAAVQAVNLKKDLKELELKYLCMKSTNEGPGIKKQIDLTKATIDHLYVLGKRVVS